MSGLFEIDRILMIVVVIAALVWIALSRDDQAENLETVVAQNKQTEKPRGGSR
jgi:hypothetical protein